MKENQNNISGETRDYSMSEQNMQDSGMTKPFDKVEENPEKMSESDNSQTEGSSKGRKKKTAPEKEAKKAAKLEAKRKKQQGKEEARAIRRRKKGARGVAWTIFYILLNVLKSIVLGAWWIIKKTWMTLLNVLLTVLIVGIITGSVVAIAFIVYINNYVDPTFDGLDNLQFDSALSTTMYYVDDAGNEVLLEEDTLKSSENRLWVDYEDIPAMLINAYIAVEDQRFGELNEYKQIKNGHEGVDTTRTASAIYNFFIPTSANYGGGSTITQQLIKNVSGENEATIQRKVQEIFRAFDVESKYTKEEIMEMYLNTIYLSHNSYGVRVAAQTYFGKELHELNLAECAAIAGIGKSPIKYDPILNPQNNLERRNLVLKLMLEQGKITQEEFDEYYDAPLTLASDDEDEDYSETVHSYYIDTVMDDVIADLMDEYGYDKSTASRVLYSGGLQIVTCLNPEIQAIAEEVYTNEDYWPEVDGIQQAQSAICIMDPENGDLLAIVGGLGEKTGSRGFNRATHAYRQCGSSIKPISVYALAIEEGIYNGGGDTVDDVPQSYNEDTRSYWPSNAGRRYLGRVSLDYAIQASLNTTAVYTCNTLGTDHVFENLVDYGYTTLVDSKILDSGATVSDIGASPLALGGFTYGVTVREHTQAYACLANGGTTSDARTYSVVRDSSGRVILDNSPVHENKYSESTAAIMTDLLTHVVNGSNGTARRAISLDDNHGIAIAAKTGTTNDNYDVYFSGYTPHLVSCVWYGYDISKTVSDGNAAAKLWDAVFNNIYTWIYEKIAELEKDIQWHQNEISSIETQIAELDETAENFEELKNNLTAAKKEYEANLSQLKISRESYSKYEDKEFSMPASVVTNVKYCTVSGKLATDACEADYYDQQGGRSCIAYGTFDASNVPTEPCDSHVWVKYDQVTGGICVDGCECPASNIVKVSLRRMTLEDRCLAGRAYVDDAEYTYMELPDGTAVCTDPDLPFFHNAFPENYRYAFGISTSERPVNRLCTEHYVAPPVTEPEIPAEPTE